MRKHFTGLLVAAALAALSFGGPIEAKAQGTRVYSACGSASYPTTGSGILDQKLTILPTGELCVNATVNASISGFHWESSLTPLAVTTITASSAAFTAGKTVIVDNVGAVNDIFCRLGPTATTAAKPIKPGTWMAFTSTSETVVACITSSSTSTANIQVGTGLATGAGGSGSGGGGGGAVTIADGSDVNEGATTDAVVAGGAAGTMSAKMRRLTTDIAALLAQTQGVTAGADAVSNTATGQLDYSRMLIFNGTTWDRWQGGIKAASGAYAAGSIADGADVNAGATADAVVAAGASGSMSAKLRRLTTDIDAIKTASTTPLDNSSVKIDVSTATTTQLVAISGTTQVRVTAWDVMAGGTGTIKFVYGTGTNCGTGTTDLTAAYPLTAQSGLAPGSGMGTLFKTAAGNALCVVTSAAVQYSGRVTYQQF